MAARAAYFWKEGLGSPVVGPETVEEVRRQLGEQKLAKLLVARDLAGRRRCNSRHNSVPHAEARLRFFGKLEQKRREDNCCLGELLCRSVVV